MAIAETEFGKNANKLPKHMIERYLLVLQDMDQDQETKDRIQYLEDLLFKKRYSVTLSVSR